MIDLQRLDKLKKAALAAQNEAAKAAGVVEILETRLREEFGIRDPAKAGAKLKQLEKEAAHLEEVYNAEFAAYDAAFAAYLGGDPGDAGPV